MNKAAKILIISILTIVLGVVGIYLLLALYYMNGFSYGTYINDVYCTGRSVEDVAAILDKSYVALDNTIKVCIDDSEYTVGLNDIDYHVDYEGALREFIASQNPFLWGLNLTNEKSGQIINPGGKYDEAKLSKVIAGWGIGRPDQNQIVRITWDGDNLTLYDGKSRTINLERAISYVGSQIASGESTISVTDDCYDEYEYTDADKKVIARYDAIRAFLDRKLGFDLGDEQLVLNDSQKMPFLQADTDGLPMLDDSGAVVLNDEVVEEIVTELLNPYNTYQNHTFTTHNGRKVYLNKGTYGNRLDIKDAVSQLRDTLAMGNDSLVTVKYLNEAKYKGLDDIGDTYVEVSIDEQHIYYYENGKLRLDSDVVTGRKNRTDTPEVVCDVYFKQRNRTLVGETYRSFVQYWIAVYNHIGIHDASWRSEFGGNLYEGGGSHGCINTPTDKVSELYDILEEGTPVIIYSYEKSGIS